MDDLRAGLESEIGEAPRTQEDAERLAKIASLLGEYIRLEREAEAVLSGAVATQASGDLAGVTLQDAAERVLGEGGIPLHVRELGKRIKGGGWRHPRSKNAQDDLINYQLAARLPRHSDRFERVAPNTFGLVRWRRGARPGRAKPRLGLFSGPGNDIARRIGDSPDEAAGASAWR
jgi:hypothetical protein